VGGDGRMFGHDHPGGLVAEDVRVGDDHGADAAGVPEVDVGSGRGGRRGQPREGLKGGFVWKVGTSSI
jgi:hypothetical protein